MPRLHFSSLGAALTREEHVQQLTRQFFTALAQGDYEAARTPIWTAKIEAVKRGDTETAIELAHLLGVSYQQEGQTEKAIVQLSEITPSNSSFLLSTKSRIHIAKALSQQGQFQLANSMLRQFRHELELAEKQGSISSEESTRLRLPMLWRIAVTEGVMGNHDGSMFFSHEHAEHSTISAYQAANSWTSAAILFGIGVRDRSLDDTLEGLSKAGEVYSTAPDEGSTYYAFRSKPLIGIILLEAALEYALRNRFTCYVRLHLVRYFAREMGIRASSEGFAEMILPLSLEMPFLRSFMEVDDFGYEDWVNSMSDADLWIEARLKAQEYIDAIKADGVSAITGLFEGGGSKRRIVPGSGSGAARKSGEVETSARVPLVNIYMPNKDHSFTFQAVHQNVQLNTEGGLGFMTVNPAEDELTAEDAFALLGVIEGAKERLAVVPDGSDKQLAQTALARVDDAVSSEGIRKVGTIRKLLADGGELAHKVFVDVASESIKKVLFPSG